MYLMPHVMICDYLDDDYWDCDTYDNDYCDYYDDDYYDH